MGVIGASTESVWALAYAADVAPSPQADAREHWRWVRSIGNGNEMKRFHLAIASVFSILAVIANVGNGYARSQVEARPYDGAEVRRAAAAIQREIRTPSHAEEALAGPLQVIVESLRSLQDLEGVPDEVLDAVAALAGSGRMASETLMRSEDRAVNALIRSARTASPRPPYPGGAMGVLQEILLQRATGLELSEESAARVRAFVRDSLNGTRLGHVELAALGSLAVATADPEWRAAAERLTDASTLAARGVPAASQAYVIARIRRALDTLPRAPAAPQGAQE